ncbi:MAG TPA: hypothetical protein VME22_26435 [Solirubrobacteraceae bacterium]|nr:hypothetical protein [Solirubrobacteraceae bacterium]
MILPAQASASTNVELSQLENFTTQQLDDYMASGASTAVHGYANGVFYSYGGTPCWYCYDTAAVGAATIGQLQDNAGFRDVAIDTMNAAIRQHQLSDGAFANDSGSADGIATGFFMVTLGVTDLELRSVLPPATAMAWANSMTAAANYLINAGDLTWYINGNVNLRQTEDMWLTYAITGQQSFLDQYNAEYQFTLAPSQSRWPGYGLQITKSPAQVDGSDGAGYLAESNTGTNPGYDPNYTDAQLDTATDLYVFTRDPKYLRLMNLLFNQLQPRIDSTWTLNATDGSRDSLDEPFLDPAVSVLAASGDRPDLAADPSSQLVRLESEYSQQQSYSNVNFYKGFESWLSMPLLDAQYPQGITAAPVSSPTTGPVVSVTPPNTSSSGGAIGVTVTNAPTNSTVTVTVSPTSGGRAATKTTTKYATKSSRASGKPKVSIAKGKARVGKKHKVKLRLRPSRKSLAGVRHKHEVVAVRTMITSGSVVRTATVIVRVVSP